jgi:hypothetical protein
MPEWLRHGSTNVTAHGSAMDSISGLGGSATSPLMFAQLKWLRHGSTNVTAHGSVMDLSSSLGGSATGPLKLHVMAPPRIRYQAWVAPPPVH